MGETRAILQNSKREVLMFVIKFHSRFRSLIVQFNLLNDILECSIVHECFKHSMQRKKFSASTRSASHWAFLRQRMQKWYFLRILIEKLNKQKFVYLAITCLSCLKLFNYSHVILLCVLLGCVCVMLTTEENFHSSCYICSNGWKIWEKLQNL